MIIRIHVLEYAIESLAFQIFIDNFGCIDTADCYARAINMLARVGIEL